MAADFGIALKAIVMTDASAALGIAQGGGSGKLRHIDVQWLWIQEVHHEGKFRGNEIAGKENPADLMTKHLSSDELNKHIERLGYELRIDRSDKSFKINAVAHQLKDEWRHDDQCLMRWHNQARTKDVLAIPSCRVPYHE